MIEIADARSQCTRKSGFWSRRNDADCADRRCSAKQRRLRSLNDFDSFDVVDVLIRPSRTRDIDAVIIQRNARRLLRRPGVRGDAANDDARVIRALLLDVEARYIVRQLVEIADAKLFKARAAHGTDGNRDIDQPLLPLLRGDNNFAFEGLIFSFLRLRKRGHRCGRKKYRKARG